MRVEAAESWKGQDVVDPDGDKVGKLEDVVFEIASGEPRFVCVKSGLLGRRLNVVPLSGASWSRDYVRVAYSRDQVKDGPQTDAGVELDAGSERELAGHYGLTLGDPPPGGGPGYESSTARGERLARAAEAEQRATEAERAADEKAAEVKAGSEAAAAGRRRASKAELEEEEARARAAQAHAEAREARGAGESR